MSLLPHSAIRKRHYGRENEINRLDKLGNTSHCRRRRWWSLHSEPPMTAAYTDACFDACVSQGSSRTVRNRPVLGRIIRRADTAAAFTHTASLYGNGHSVLRCVARVVARSGSGGGMSPNRRLSGFLTAKLALLGRRACFIQYSKVLQTTAKRSSPFLRKNALALSFCSNQCKTWQCPCA